MSRDIRPYLFNNNLFDLPRKMFGHLHVLPLEDIRKKLSLSRFDTYKL